MRFAIVSALAASGLLVLRLAVEPYCTSRPAPEGALEPNAVLNGAAIRRFTAGNDAGARALTWARLAVDANAEPLARPGLSWEYGQLDAVTALDRNFRSAYSFGSGFLSTLRRDTEGGRRILEKWVRYEPASWRSHASLGYHLYFEMDRPDLAAPHLLRAAAMEGAPAWLAALGARVMSETERLPQQLRRLVELYAHVPPGLARQRLALRIRAVRLRYESERLERAVAAYREKHRRTPARLADAAPFLEAPSRTLAALASDVPAIEEVRRDLAALFAERFEFRYDPTSGALTADVDPAIQRLGVLPAMNRETAGDETEGPDR